VPGLIAHSVLRAPRGRLLGLARQRLARSSLGRFWEVFTTNMSGWRRRARKADDILPPHSQRHRLALVRVVGQG
jgi:hypothetical protein